MTDFDVTTALATTGDDSFSMGRWLFTPTGVELTGIGEPPTLQEWKEGNRFIRSVNEACQWWWGDWSNYGEMAFGEEAAQAIDPTCTLAVETLKDYAYVAANVPKENRRRLSERPSFSHYRILVNHSPRFTADEQAEWVDRIESEKLTVRQLRKLLRDSDDRPTKTEYSIEIECRTAKDARAVKRYLRDFLDIDHVEIGKPVKVSKATFDKIPTLPTLPKKLSLATKVRRYNKSREKRREAMQTERQKQMLDNHLEMRRMAGHPVPDRDESPAHVSSMELVVVVKDDES